MTREVKLLEPSMYQAWDEYVNQHSDGTFYHLSGWQAVIDRAFSHPCYFAYVIDGGAISAILPLVHVNSRLFGNALVSTPFCMQGGILADTATDHQLLVNFAKSHAHRLEVEYIEFRNQVSLDPCSEMTVPEEDSHVLFGCQLAANDSDILASIKKKQRAVIRQSLTNDLRYEIENHVDNVYQIYSLSVRNLGTPVFSKQLFKQLLAIFPEQCEILTVYHQDIAVSSVMSFYYKGTVLPHFGGGTLEARGLKSNDYMYYQLMCHSAKRDCHTFDFGRSKIDSGAYYYKKHWGMTPTIVSNHYYLHRAQHTPSLNVTNPKYALAINVWKKLPLSLSQIIGPKLSKYLG